MKSPAIVLLLAMACFAQAPAVPPVYQDLYTQLSGDIGDFQGKITSLWNGSLSPVNFSAQLTAANSNNGPNLLQPTSFTLIQAEIQFLKNMGVKAVSVEVSFPMLYQPFFDSIGQSSYQSQFATFYANVAAAIRAQGMKVIVESQSMIPTGLQSVWGTGLQNFYRSLTTFQQYGTARAQAIGVVANTMHPDYFVLQEEPDTEASQSGQPDVGAVAGSTAMLNGSIAAARAAKVPGMLIGAGFGSWLQAYQLFANSFTQQHCGPSQPCISQPLDFLDMHLFPIIENATYCTPLPNSQRCTTPNFWENALAIVNTANAANKPMTISQTWLRKVRDSEWSQISGDIQEAREAYSFWAPLDLLFLQTVYDLANYNQMLFVVPFNTQNYMAYLDWSGGSSTCTLPDCTAIQGEGGGNTPAQVFSAVQSAALANLPSSGLTTTGAGFRNLIAAAFIVSLSAGGKIEPFAPESIVSAYGANLSDTVSVTDSASVSRPAFLFYTSPLQVNFEIPPGTAAGPATVTIGTQSNVIEVGNVSPGLFAQNTSGLAAAYVLPVISGVDQAAQLVSGPISLGPSTEQVYLELYGTGIRNAQTVTATIGGLNIPVLFAGAAPGFIGLDQVNIGPLPAALAGQGTVNIILSAEGQTANTVNVTIQ